MPVNIDVNKIKLDKEIRMIIKAYCLVLLLAIVGFMLLLAHNILTDKHGKIWGWEYNRMGLDYNNLGCKQFIVFYE